MDVRHPLLIRKYAPGDIGTVATLCGELGYSATEAQIAERIGQMGPNLLLLVAADRDSATVVGWIELLVVTHITSGLLMEISGLVVSEAMRSMGIGGQLVEAAEEAGRKMGISRLRVRSNIVRDRAHAFYERLGYKNVKTSKVFEKML